MLTTQEISDRRLGKRKVGKEYPFPCPDGDSRRWACSSFRPDGTVSSYIDEAVDKPDSPQDALCHFCNNQNSYGKYGCPNHYTDED